MFQHRRETQKVEELVPPLCEMDGQHRDASGVALVEVLRQQVANELHRVDVADAVGDFGGELEGILEALTAIERGHKRGGACGLICCCSRVVVVDIIRILFEDEGR